MKRTILAAICLAALAGLALANRDQLELTVTRILPQYGYKDVDVSTLSTAQLAQINALAHSNRGQAHIRGSIGATLNGRIIKFLRNL